MLDETVVRSGTKGGESLRTTIPKAVLNLLSLKVEDKILWKIEAVPGQKDHVRVYLEKGEWVTRQQ